MSSDEETLNTTVCESKERDASEDKSDLIAMLQALRSDIKGIQRDIHTAHVGIKNNQSEIKSLADRQLKQFEYMRDFNNDSLENTNFDRKIPDTVEANINDVPQVHGCVNSQEHANVPEVVAQLSQNNVQLHDLPKFSGNTEDWPLLKRTYDDSTNLFRYNSLQNLMRLRKCLVGEAKEAVASLLIYPDNVRDVIEELEFRFGRPELLIRSQLARIREFPKVAYNKPEQIVTFATNVRGVVHFLSAANHKEHLNNPILLEELLTKLPTHLQMDWLRVDEGKQVAPSIAKFSEWLSSIARVVGRLPAVVDTSGRQFIARNTKPIFIANTQTAVECILCKECHDLESCKMWKENDTKSRWNIVKEHRLCFACLRKGHNAQNCRIKQACPFEGCQYTHHSSLHNVSQIQNLQTTDPKPLLNCSSGITSSSPYLFKVIPVVLYGQNGNIETYAMFDDGSSVTLMEEAIADKLGLEGERSPLTLQWYDNKQSLEMSKRVRLEITGMNDHVRYDIKNVQTVKRLDLPSQSFSRDQHDHIANVPILDYSDAKPVLLIGLDNLHLGLPKRIIERGNLQPVAIDTKLGWLAYGPNSEMKRFKTSSRFRVHFIADETKWQEMVSEFVESENFGLSNLPPIESIDDARVKALMAEKTIRIGKQFEIGLPWKENVAMPDSYKMAEKRLYGIEKKMNANPEFAKKYRTEMAKYVEKGYARELSRSEINDVSNPVWYIPHFAVQSVHKPDKMRVVFDAAAEVEGMSLNKALLKGPDNLKPLVSILMQFRQNKVGVTADIREMFSQIKIRENEQNAQRFLWRDGDTSEPIRHFAMTSLIFGAICSPFCANYVKNLNAEDFKDQFPKARHAIVEHHYVDDLVMSFESEEEAIEICQQVVRVHAEGGFELRSFSSNSDKLQNIMNNHHEPNMNSHLQSQLASEKVLGMFWNTQLDVFQFETKFHRIPQGVINGTRVPTKRELLGMVMAIFDPFGLIADYHISAKIMVQSTWSLGTNWDEAIPLELHPNWKCWLAEIHNMHNFKVPRMYSTNLSCCERLEMHIFVDASQAAFAAVAYLRVICCTVVDIAFVMGKTRLAPKKLLSIPRLELQAAVLGIRLNRLLQENNRLPIQDTFFWSDSKTVLQWVHSKPRKFKPFVGHRITEILSSSTESQWNWVPSSCNTADAATRLSNSPKMSSQSPWILGPSFLKLPCCDWPRMTDTKFPDVLEEEIPERPVLKCQVAIPVIDFNRFSCYSNLKRVVAWVMRAKRSWLKLSNQKGPLPVEELAHAEAEICRMVQQEAFPDEIKTLRNEQMIIKHSRIYELSPYIETDGLLHLSGRIDEASYLPQSRRRPILLPKDHKVSYLLMRYFHTKYHHQNQVVVINESRQKFWIPHIKRLLRKVTHECNRCIIDKGLPKIPRMGQLPPDRLTPYVRPFTYTGVDLFGPLTVTVGRRHEKRWGVIFTCMTIRAAHIELAADLSTDAFILCLRNFINRRGTPVMIRSDNGTNFIGTAKELKNNEHLLDLDAITNEAAQKGIKWVFNCPLQPNAGGCWERLIGIIKKLMSKTLHSINPRVETLQSVLIEAENIINSRPLTELPITHEDEEPLTPNHFLMGCTNSTQTPQPTVQNICLKKQWRIAQALKDRIWKKWIVEYLPQLVQGSKWHQNTTPLKVDDLVLIMDSASSRSTWKRGRIIKVFTGKDHQVRSADVKTVDNVLHRPASKLIRLQLYGESEDDSRLGRV